MSLVLEHECPSLFALVHVLGEHDANMLFDICVGHLYDNSKQASKISPCHGHEKFFDEMTGKTLGIPIHHTSRGARWVQLRLSRTPGERCSY